MKFIINNKYKRVEACQVFLHTSSLELFNLSANINYNS